MESNKPLSFDEFIRGRVCRGGQIRLDYEDYLNDFYDGEEAKQNDAFGIPG